MRCIGAYQVAQQTDVPVAPVPWPGLSPYHRGFPGTITLSVYDSASAFEATESPRHHGFRRIMFVNGHVGNTAVTQFVIDKINLETKGTTAVDLREAATPFEKIPRSQSFTTMLDQHAGVPETSNSLTTPSRW